jgi:hypothetical protein
MLSPAIIPAIQAFGATLAFVTVCLALTKTLVDAGFLKTHACYKGLASDEERLRITFFKKS